MESVSPERPFRSFSETEKSTLNDFSAELLPELKRKPSPLDDADVFERLTSFVSDRLSWVSGLHDPFFQLSHPKDDGQWSLEIQAPIVISGEERKQVVVGLDSDHRLGDRSRLSAYVGLGRSDYLPLILRIFRERYHGVCAELVDALMDTLSQHGAPVDASWNQSVDALLKEGQGNELRLLKESFQSFTGSEVFDRINANHREWTLERTMDACVRVFLRSAEVRSALFLCLRNFVLLGHAALAESITRQAHLSLMNMEGMTEYDQWTYQREQKEIEAGRIRQTFKDAANMLAGTNGIDPSAITIESAVDYDDCDGYLNDPFPEPLEVEEIPETFLDPLDRIVHFQAIEYLQTHEPQARTKLLESLDAKGCWEKMEELRSTYSWHALGAFQRSVLARIYEEVIRFPYGIPEVDHDIVEEYSHETSSPAFAVRERRLNCLTADWLMTVLAVECGIGYHQISFCSVNLDDSMVTGAHGKLLFSLEDGTLVMMDPSYRLCLQQVPLTSIKSNRELRSLKASHTQRFADAHGAGMKSSVDPVRIHIDPAIAVLLGLPEDFHLLTPDQAFAARSLYNVGISFEREGRRAEAKHAYEVALAIEPTNSYLLSRLGNFALGDGNLVEAKRCMLHALRANHTCVHTVLLQAMISVQEGLYDDALRLLQILSDDPRKVWGHPEFYDEVCRLMDMVHLQNEAAIEVQRLMTMLKGVQSKLTDSEKHLL